MRTTTKMLVAAAQNARKRDSRGRFTSEQGGGARMDGGYMNGGYRMDGGYESRMNEPRNYGDNRRGETRNDGDYRPYMNDRDNDKRRGGGGGYEPGMYGVDRVRYGNPMPNYNIPEGRDIEHGEQRTSNRTYDMDDDEPRIGFRSWPKNSTGGERGRDRDNVVSMQQQRGHSMQHDHEPEEFTDELAEKWVKSMKNKDGTKGAHWNREQTKQVMKHMGVQGIEPHEFYAVMNAMYSDYCAAAKKFGVDTSEFYGELAKAWLQDEDAVEDKAAAYYCYVVEH